MFKKKFIIALSVIFSVFLIYITFINPIDDTVIHNKDSDFTRLSDSVFKSMLPNDSFSLHYYLKNPDTFEIGSIQPSIGSFNYNDMQNNNSYYMDFLSTLKKIDYPKLSENEKIAYDSLVFYFRNEMDFSDYSLNYEILTPTTGIQAQLPILLNQYTFESIKDVEDYLAILSTIPAYFDDICNFEELKAKNGYFMSSDNVDKIVKQCQTFTQRDNNFLIEDFPSRLEKLNIKDSNVLDKLIKQNNNAIDNYVIPSYSQLEQKLTSLSTSFASSRKPVHMCDYTNGKNYYSYLARRYTGSTKTVHRMEQMIKDKLKNDVSILMKYTGKSEIINEIDKVDSKSVDAKEIVDSQIKDCLSDFPKPVYLNYQIKYVPESLEKYLSPAFYIVPPIDMPRQNIIYVNQSLNTGYIDMYSTLAHEGFPGHLYQCTYFSSQNPLLIRHLLDFDGYTEGWATYCELYCYKYLFKSTDTVMYMIANASYSLAIHALADIGVNYHGWSQGQLASNLQKYGVTDSESVSSVYSLVTESPANYLKYYFGYLEILSLKEAFKQQYGVHYTDKKFHAFIVKFGPAPFDVIKKHILNS